MRPFFIHVLIFNFTCLIGFSQRFEGSVMDSATLRPMPYVYIFNDILEIGTITNADGKFVLPLRTEDSLEVTISHVGFMPKKIFLHKNKLVTVHLTQHTVMLHEVEVDGRANSIVKSIFQKFISQRPVKFSKAFYRQVTIVGDAPSEFFETFNTISSSSSGIEKHAMYESRYARAKESSLGNPAFYYTNFSYLTFGFRLFTPKSNNIVKPFTADYIDRFDYYISKSFKSNGCEYVVIQYEPAEDVHVPAFTGEFTVNVTKQTLLTYSASTRSSLGIDSMRIKRAGNKTQLLTADHHLFEWDFRFDDNLPDAPLASIHVTSSFDLHDGSNTRKVKTSSVLLVFENDVKKKKGLREPDAAQNDIEQIRKKKHDPEFWKNNPVIQRTDFEEQTIQFFEESNAFGSYFNN